MVRNGIRRLRTPLHVQYKFKEEDLLRIQLRVIVYCDEHTVRRGGSVHQYVAAYGTLISFV